MRRTITRIIMSLVIIVAGGAIAAAYTLEYIIDTLEQNIEERALPVLQIDIPEIRKKLFKIFPHPKDILECLPFCSTIADKVVEAVKRPLIKKILTKTRDDLNNELNYVKIRILEYEEDEKQRTITAHCTYGITVILTGETFNQIVETHRNWLTLTFICD